ncbi:hypothetical protein RFI_03644, partial [Reticulomyxa filosa]
MKKSGTGSQKQKTKEATNEKKKPEVTKNVVCERAKKSSKKPEGKGSEKEKKTTKGSKKKKEEPIEVKTVKMKKKTGTKEADSSKSKEKKGAGSSGKSSGSKRGDGGNDANEKNATNASNNNNNNNNAANGNGGGNANNNNTGNANSDSNNAKKNKVDKWEIMQKKIATFEQMKKSNTSHDSEITRTKETYHETSECVSEELTTEATHVLRQHVVGDNNRWNLEENIKLLKWFAGEGADDFIEDFCGVGF